MKSLQRLLIGCGFVLAVLSAALFAIGLSAQWGSAASFDVLGLLPFLRNIGHLFAYFWGIILAAGAFGRWLKAATLAN